MASLRSSLRLLCSLSILFTFCTAGFAEPIRLRWSLSDSAVARYDYQTSGLRGRTHSETVLVSASEIEDGRKVRLENRSLNLGIFFLSRLLSVPAQKLTARTWKETRQTRITFYPKCQLHVRFNVRRLDDGIEIRGEWRTVLPAKGGLNRKDLPIRCRTTAIWDAEAGRVRSGTIQLKGLPDRLQAYGPAEGTVTFVDVLDPESPEFFENLPDAVQRGRNFLLKDLETRPYSMGRTALALYALCRAGADPDHPVLKNGFKKLASLPFQRVYDVSCYIFALDARSQKRIETGDRAGTLPRFEKGKLKGRDRQRMKAAANWLVETQSGPGRWGYGPGRRSGDYWDNSNTQFAVLALHVAAQSGLRIPRATWQRVATHFIKYQQPSGPKEELEIERYPSFEAGEKGEKKQKRGTESRNRWHNGEKPPTHARGWGYFSDERARIHARDTMTCAGLSSAVIAEHHLAKAGGGGLGLGRLTRCILDGLAWLQKNYRVQRNFYLLYSLEKACDLAGVRTFGGRDWRQEGMTRLVLWQNQDGSWSRGPAQPGDVVATSFALLFLNGATLPVDGRSREISLGTGTRARSAPLEVTIEGLGAVAAPNALKRLDTCPKGEFRARMKIAQRVLERIDPTDAPRLIPVLLDLLSSSRRPVQKLATRSLKKVTQKKLRTKEAYAAWYERWKGLAALSDPTDADGRALLRDVLEGEDGPVLIGRAIRTTRRLDAWECADAVIDRLEADDESVRLTAFRILAGWVGETFDYDPDARRKEREEAANRFRSWLEENRKKRLQDRRARVLLGRIADLDREIADREARMNRQGADAPSTEEIKRLGLEIASLKEKRKAPEEKLLALDKTAIPILIETWKRGEAGNTCHRLLIAIVGKDAGSEPAAWENHLPRTD